MKNALHEMLRQIRGFTISMLERTPPAWLLYASEGTSNHILWHAGHAVWLQDKLCVEPLTGKSELPEGWSDRFGMDCQPVAQQKHWPESAQILKMLSDQHSRLGKLFDAMTAEQLVIRPEDNRDLVGGIIHGLHDEAKHQGEMYLLFKLRASQEQR